MSGPAHCDGGQSCDLFQPGQLAWQWARVVVIKSLGSVFL
jgi:hypothetical protein